MPTRQDQKRRKEEAEAARMHCLTPMCKCTGFVRRAGGLLGRECECLHSITLHRELTETEKYCESIAKLLKSTPCREPAPPPSRFVSASNPERETDFLPVFPPELVERPPPRYCPCPGAEFNFFGFLNGQRGGTGAGGGEMVGKRTYLLVALFSVNGPQASPRPSWKKKCSTSSAQFASIRSSHIAGCWTLRFAPVALLWSIAT